MKIILATPLYPPEIGGPATYVKELAERLRGEHTLTIVAYANAVEPVAGVPIIATSKRFPLPVRLPLYMWRLYKAARGADVIYVQNAVAAGLPAVLVGMMRHIPVTVKFVGDEAWERATQSRKTTQKLEDFLEHPDSSLGTKLFMRIQGFVLRRAACVTTPSAYLADALAHTYHVPKEKLLVNYNAADKTETLPFAGDVIPHRIVATARLVEWKGIDGIIRALAEVKKEFPDVSLVIAGDGPEEKNLRMLAEELSFAKSVTFLGRVSRAETWHIRKTGEVYVLNSTYEGLPHTVLTSFAAEIPTVATNVAGTNEAVYHEETGLLVPPGDDAALASSIVRLFKDEALKKKIVQGATKLLAEKFSWEAHLRTLTDALEASRFQPRNEVR